MKLCDNCLDVVPESTRPFPLGHARGSQRDPYDVSVTLCEPCADCLGGRMADPPKPIDLHLFAERNNTSTTVDRRLTDVD